MIDLDINRTPLHTAVYAAEFVRVRALQIANGAEPTTANDVGHWSACEACEALDAVMADIPEAFAETTGSPND